MHAPTSPISLRPYTCPAPCPHVPVTLHPLAPPLAPPQVVDGASLAQGGSDAYCVVAVGGPLRITLAWWVGLFAAVIPAGGEGP